MTSLYQDFASRAEALGAEVWRVLSIQEAAEKIYELLVEAGVNQVAAGQNELPQQVARLLNENGIRVLSGKDALNLAAQVEVGITQVELGIAELGTLVTDGVELENRLISMLPPIHVALLYTSDLVEDLPVAFDFIRNKFDRIPGYLSFITGPSRTADIERVLTIGVHGPGRLIIFCIDQDKGSGVR